MSRRCGISMRALYTMLAALRRLHLLVLASFWLVQLVCFGSPIEAQQREMQLSLREATAFALQGNLDIQIAGLTPRIREAQVLEQRGIFDVTAQAEATVSNNRLLGTSSRLRERINGNLVAQENAQQQRLELGISQLTPYGGTYELSVAETHLETTESTSATAELISQQGLEQNAVPPAAPRGEFFVGEVELKLKQPLLKNFGSVVTKNQILIAQNNLAISQEEFRQRIITVTSQVQQIYWDLVFRRQDLEVRRQQRALAQKLLEQIRKQVAVGTLAPLEVVQAETNIARVEERILVAENALRTAEDRLKRVMNLSFTGELADTVLSPVDMPRYVPPSLQSEEEIRQALRHRPDLVQAKLALENQHITLVFNKNQALPTLDIEASLGFNGIDTGFASSLGEVDPGSRYRWEVGLVFRHPLANRRARGQIEQSQLAIRQQLLGIKNLEENIMVEVRAAVRDVVTNSQRVQASRVARRLAEKQLEAEEKKLQVGLATVFTVLQFQDDLSVERSNEINTLTGYLQALVRLEEVKSTILESYNIVVQQDGPRLQ